MDVNNMFNRADIIVEDIKTLSTNAEKHVYALLQFFNLTVSQFDLQFAVQLQDMLSTGTKGESKKAQTNARLQSQTNFSLVRLKSLIQFMEFFKKSGRKRVLDIREGLRNIGLRALTLTSEMETIKRKVKPIHPFLKGRAMTQEDDSTEKRNSTMPTDNTSQESGSNENKNTCNINLKDKNLCQRIVWEIENDTIVPDITTDLQSWDEQTLHDLLIEVEHYQPLKDIMYTEEEEIDMDVPFVNILLVGPSESGKSSFVNTVESVFRGRTVIKPHDRRSRSITFHSFNIGRTRKKPKFNMCIYRGPENENDGNKMEADIQYIIKGHIKNDYVFTGNSIAADNPNYRRYPKINDRMHCFVFVFDSCQPLIMNSFLQQTATVHESLNDANIPQLILMTKTDTLSQLIQKDLSKTFHSKCIQIKKQQFARCLGLPEYSVLSMKNIHIEHIVDTSLKILTLYNLRRMLMFTAGFLLNNQEELEQDTYEREYDVSIDKQYP